MESLLVQCILDKYVLNFLFVSLVFVDLQLGNDKCFKTDTCVTKDFSFFGNLLYKFSIYTVVMEISIGLEHNVMMSRPSQYSKV